MKKITVKLTKDQFLRLNAYQHHLLMMEGEKTSKQDIFIMLLESLLRATDDNIVLLDGDVI
jgi:hypothetical protein